DRVVLPSLEERRGDVTGAVAPHQVDFAIEIARGHKGAQIRHRRPRTPGVGSNVVDARSINHRSEGDLLATEDEELVHIRRIYPGSLGVVEIGDGGKRCPSVGDWIEPAELSDIIADREGVTATFIGKGAIAIHEPAVVIYRYRRRLRPRPRCASSGCARRRRRWRSRRGWRWARRTGWWAQPCYGHGVART